MSAAGGGAPRPVELRGSWLAGPGAVALAAAVAALLVYANLLHNQLAYDDFFLIDILARWREQPWAQRLLARRALTFYALDTQRALWGGFWPLGFHATSVLLHAVTSALAALAALRLSGSRRVAAATGLLFALHPVHVEAVASFANLGDVLGTLFALAALVLWVSPGRPVARSAAALGCVALAFAAKETVGAGIAPVLLLWDLLLRRDEPLAGRVRKTALRVAILAAISGAAVAFYAGELSQLYEPARIAAETEGQVGSTGALLATSAASFSEVLRLLFAPLTLSADYPPVRLAGFGDPAALLGLCLLALWLGVALFLLSRSPLASFAMLWVPLAYLPDTNLVPLTQFFRAERYLYLPSFGACLLAALVFRAGWDALARRRPTARFAWLAAALVLLGAAGARTALRNRDWYDNATLARAALRDGMQTWRMHGLLAEQLLNWSHPEMALDHMRRAVELRPTSPRLRYVLALMLLEEGETEEARRQVREADALGLPRPYGAARTLYELALAFLRAGWLADAADRLELGLRLEPGHAPSAEALAWLRATAPQAWMRDGKRALALVEAAERAGAPPARVECARAAALSETHHRRRARAAAQVCLERAQERGETQVSALAERLEKELRAGRHPRRDARELAALLTQSS